MVQRRRINKNRGVTLYNAIITDLEEELNNGSMAILAVSVQARRAGRAASASTTL